MRRVLLCVACAAGVAIQTYVAPAGATTREGISVTAEKPVAEKTYPALSGNVASSDTTVTNWRTCQSATSCDSIKLDTDPKKKYAHFTTRVTLTYPNHQSNDVNIAVWDPNSTIPYATREERTQGGTYPKVVDVGTDTPEAMSRTLIVDNTTGTNAGYTIHVAIIEVVPGSSGGATPTPRPTPRPATPTPKPSTPQPTLPPLPAFEAPTPTPRTIRTPGPDGSPTDIELPIVAGGVRRPETTRNTAGVVALVSGAVAVVGGSGAALLIVRRRRRGA